MASFRSTVSVLSRAVLHYAGLVDLPVAVLRGSTLVVLFLAFSEAEL